jgi:hypothetical protein
VVLVVVLTVLHHSALRASTALLAQPIKVATVVAVLQLTVLVTSLLLVGVAVHQVLVQMVLLDHLVLLVTVAQV